MARSSVTRWLAPASLLLLQLVVSPLQGWTGSGTDGGAVRLAAADTGDSGTGTATAVGNLDATDSYRLALLKLKGHLGVARTLLRIRAPGAEYHLRQPVQEIFRTIQPELESQRAPLTADIVDQLRRATETTPQAALTIVDSVASAIDGSFAHAGALDARSVLLLSDALLRAAVGLYANSVVDNEVVDVPRYQTGRGFVIQAEALVRHASGLHGKPGQEALLAAVVLIRQAWPGVMPPPIVFDPESVRGRLEEAEAIMDRLS